MRVSGSSDHCRAAAAELERAAVAVADVAVTLGALRSSEQGWSGVAAQCWSAVALAQADAGREVAQRLVAAARVLRRHAEDLGELQARAARLTQEAAEAGLVLSVDGDIARVVVEPVDPCPTPEQLARQQAQLRREQAREELLRRVAALRREEQWAHDQLSRWLRALDLAWSVLTSGAAPAGGPGGGTRSRWAPTPADLPPAALDAGSEIARSRPPAWVPTVLRSAAAGPLLGAGYGIWVDTSVRGKDVREAVAKNVVVSGTGAAAGYVVASSSAAAGPPGLVVAGGVVVGVTVTYLGGRVWDAIADAVKRSRRAGGGRPPAPVGLPGGVRPLGPPVPRPPLGPAPRPLLGGPVLSGALPGLVPRCGRPVPVSTRAPLLHRSPAATPEAGGAAAPSR